MASWRFAIGNLGQRAAAAPAAVAPATADPELPLTNLSTGYPDEQAAFAWRADGAYAADLDLNLLAVSSARADAPTGWTDLLNLLAYTPGLPANPPDWGNYGGRNPALRLYRPVVQLVDVMPGEAVKLSCSIRWPAAAAGATGVRLRVVDGWSGKGWNGATWADGGVLDSQLVADAWKDVAEQIDADPARVERSVYQVIIEPIAAAFDATTYCYASANGAAGSPALFAELDTVAIVGHNLPANAQVTLVPQPAGTTLTLVPVQPSMYVVGAAQLVQTWRLTIQMPAGNQPRPVLGELWVGKASTLLGGAPGLPISVSEGEPGQIRQESQVGRVEVLGTGTPTRASMMLQFTFEDAAYRQARDQVARLTRHGQEPMLLLPDESFEGSGRLYHGRLGDEVAYSRIAPGTTEAIRTFTWAFEEGPLAASS